MILEKFGLYLIYFSAAAIGMVTTLSLHHASDGTYRHTVLERTGTGAQGPNSGSELIYER